MSSQRGFGIRHSILFHRKSERVLSKNVKVPLVVSEKQRHEIRKAKTHAIVEITTNIVVYKVFPVPFSKITYLSHVL